jgi:hypothetical protein
MSASLGHQGVPTTLVLFFSSFLSPLQSMSSFGNPVFVLFFSVLRTELRALCVLGKRSTDEPHPQLLPFLNVLCVDLPQDAPFLVAPPTPYTISSDPQPQLHTCG